MVVGQKRYLHVAEHALSLLSVGHHAIRLSHSLGKNSALAQGAVLSSIGEEAVTLDFLPKVEGLLTPASSNIVKVQLGFVPDWRDTADVRSAREEVVGIGDERDGAESGAVALRTAGLGRVRSRV